MNKEMDNYDRIRSDGELFSDIADRESMCDKNRDE